MSNIPSIEQVTAILHAAPAVLRGQNSRNAGNPAAAVATAATRELGPDSDAEPINADLAERVLSLRTQVRTLGGGQGSTEETAKQILDAIESDPDGTETDPAALAADARTPKVKIFGNQSG